MQRFTDQPLRARPHIAVIGSDKVGNFVVTTPLLRGLREKYPSATLDFFGSEVTQSFEVACPFIDARFSLYGDPDVFLERLCAFVRARRSVAGDYDLVINCNAFSEASVVLAALLRPRYVVGQALSTDLRGRFAEDASDARSRLSNDSQWNRPDLTGEYPDLLGTGFIGEIFCRLAFVDTDMLRPELPSRPPGLPLLPPVLIHTSASRPAKEWPIPYWCEVIRWCRSESWSVGIVGAGVQTTARTSPDPCSPLIEEGAIDLRGRMSLPELAGAFQRARLAVVVDSGPMHVAAAVGCQTVCIFGNDTEGDGVSPFHLWAPRGPHIHIVHSPIKCRRCTEARFRNSHCLVSGHPCLRSIDPDAVIDTLKGILACQE